MKHLIYAFLAVMIAFTLQAQDRDQERDRDQVRLEEHLLIQDGKVLQIQDRDRVQLREQLALQDGSIVYPDGTYRHANGLKLQLQNGQCLDMKGNFYGSSEQFRQQMQLRNQAENQLHYTFIDGKVQSIQNQEQKQLQQRLNLANGGVLHPNGNLQLRDQEQKRLRDGECVDPEGNLYNNRDQFRQHMQLQLQALNQEHFMYQDGQMHQMQNGKQEPVREQLKLQSGLVVNPNGSYKLQNQERMQLQQGEYLDAAGNSYASREQFRQQALVRLQAMNQAHFEAHNGQLYHVQNQVRARVNETLSLPNGMTVNPDASYRLQNRQQNRLSDGECLDGEGNQFRSQQQYHQHMQTRITAMSEPHFQFQDGNVYRFQNHMQYQLHEPWKLGNGGVIKPDGSYTPKNGKKEMLKNGEYLDMDGKRYENRERFKDRMEQRVRDRMDLREREKREQRGKVGSGKRIGN
ncbi:hypothetical protein JMN32_20690 [Fulvivirga sp. 29W222]|uniref:DUF6799 domain-containing protein n=1 Tax=Fulvivirga marina TaxID=2494733 RepID=A0A937KDL4_9BACT|nr:DUF6799 domain-containing protein [Fulvivirga marina]MBL6448742.1 hypothetical protein [Fulvivirga marina]